MKKIKKIDYDEYSFLLHEVQDLELQIYKIKKSGLVEFDFFEGQEIEIARKGHEKEFENYEKLKEAIAEDTKIIEQYEQQQREIKAKIEENNVVPNKIKGSISRKLTKELNKTDYVGTDFGMDIEELKDNRLHQILKKSRLYRLYYSLCRVKYNGMYHRIPGNFIVWMQNVLRSTGKLTIKDQSFKPLAILFMAISGAGKSDDAEFHIGLSKDIISNEKEKVPMCRLDSPSPEKLRGSCEYVGNESYSIQPGVVSDCLLYIDELKNTMMEIPRNSKLRGYLVNLVEGEEISGDTLKGVGCAGRYDDWLHKVKSASTDEEKKKLKRLNLVRENKYFRLDLQSEGDRPDLFFKNNAGLVMYCQPITAESDRAEKAVQESFGFRQGFYNRFIFVSDKHKNTLTEEKIHLKERVIYIERLVATSKFKNVDDLMKHNRKEFVTTINSLPEVEMDFNTTFQTQMENDFLNNLFSEKDLENEYSLDKVLLDLIENENGGKMNEFIFSYFKRLRYNIYPKIAYTLAYLNGKKIPEKEEIMSSIYVCNGILKDYFKYIEQVVEEAPIISKTANISIYTNLIITFLCENCQSKTRVDTLDVFDKYPFLSELKTKCKNLFMEKYGENSWNQSKFNTAFKILKQNDKIRVVAKNPKTGKSFKDNKKIVVLYMTDKNVIMEMEADIEDMKRKYKW